MEFGDIVRIAAFLPVYRKSVGQGVEVYFRDGSTVLLDVGIRSFIQKVARAFAVNVKDIRREFGPIVGQKNLVPLVLAPFLLYVPFKTRQPLVGGDSAYGYFRLRSIVDVSPAVQTVAILLEGGASVAVRQSYRTICSRLRAVRKLEAFLLERFHQAMDGCLYPFTIGLPGLSGVLQENCYPYGILRTERKGEPGVELKNLMEALVWQRLDEVMDPERGAGCWCDQCRMDMAALALNGLPPRYVVTQRGETYSKADILEIQRYVDVVAAVTKAVRTVRQNPRHA